MIYFPFKRYFFTALIVKTIVFVLFAFYFHLESEKQTVKFLFAYSRDYRSYIDPAVNFVDSGEYFEQSADKRLYAHKMPGMLPVFAPLYGILGFQNALLTLVVFQLLLDCICCVLLAKIAVWLFQNECVAKPVFYSYLLSTTVSVSSHFAVSEFLCTSFGIVAFYFCAKDGKPLNSLVSGIFATWATFFRPTGILILIALFVLICIINMRKRQRFLIKTLVYFCLPFMVFEGAWIIRNYKVFGRIVPAELSYENFGNPPMKAVFSFIQGIGGDLQSWNENSEMRWFNGPGSKDYDSTFVATFPFPEYLISCGISETSIRFLRSQYLEFDNTQNDSMQRSFSGRNTVFLATFFSNNVKKYAPLQYYVLSPLKTLGQLVFIKRPYGFSFSTTGIIQKAIRGWHFISYYLGILVFISGVFLSLLSRNNMKIKTMILLVFIHLLLYGFLLRYTENRYVVPMYPFMLTVGIGLIIAFINRNAGLKITSE